jgi:amino acid transporter
METEPRGTPALRRTLTLPWLVFYGLGVTIGAGIFALIGEILAIAGDRAPLAFLLAGLTAGATGISYGLLVTVFPKAGGEAVFVSRGLGPRWGRLVGIGVAATAIVSSAAIALAFTGYARLIAPLPAPVLLVMVIGGLTVIAARGIRESMVFAALITILEVTTLFIVAAVGLPGLTELEFPQALIGTHGSGQPFLPVIMAAMIAFFAFIGFEDIENMAEETKRPERTIPLAIVWTLAVTVLLYLLLALVAVATPFRDEIAGSPAPVAVMFERLTGIDPAPVSAIAAIAMTNGILVQVVMASRVLYGTANEGLLPSWFARVNAKSRTPARATLFVSGLILALALLFPLAGLAEATSLIVIAVFALVNLSLFTLGGMADHTSLSRWRWWGLAAFLLCLGMLGLNTYGLIVG